MDWLKTTQKKSSSSEIAMTAPCSLALLILLIMLMTSHKTKGVVKELAIKTGKQIKTLSDRK